MQHERRAPSRTLVLLMALACGVGVANLYFPQAITPLLARHLHVSEASAAFVATIMQLGYVFGVFLLVPLGDRLPRKPLIASLFMLAAIGLFIAGSASSLPLLLIASALIGLVTVVPQMLIPMAADLALPGQAGRTVGTVQGGLLGGILLARAFGGTLGEWFGWRAPYLVSGSLAVVIAVALIAALPSTKVSSSQHYPALVATSVRLFGVALGAAALVPLPGVVVRRVHRSLDEHRALPHELVLRLRHRGGGARRARGGRERAVRPARGTLDGRARAGCRQRRLLRGDGRRRGRPARGLAARPRRPRRADRGDAAARHLGAVEPHREPVPRLRARARRAQPAEQRRT